MSTWFKIFLLAVVQGVTEFLPVSSSGHLVLSEHFLGLKGPEGVLLEVILHAGTLVSIFVYYRKRILELVLRVLRGEREAWQYAGILLLACVPAGLAFATLGDFIEARFDDPMTAGAMLCVTGMLLLSLRWIQRPADDRTTPLRALLMGIGQAVAMLPGISRSGTTISTGRMLGLDAQTAAELSFFMLIPALSGATLLKVVDLIQGDAAMGEVTVGQLGLGFAVSAAVGYASMVLLLRTLSRGSFWRFSFYCLPAGILAMAALWIRG